MLAYKLDRLGRAARQVANRDRRPEGHGARRVDDDEIGLDSPHGLGPRGDLGDAFAEFCLVKGHHQSPATPVACRASIGGAEDVAV
jgi:hypothetical protein